MKKLQSSLFSLVVILAAGCGHSHDDHDHDHSNQTANHAPPHGGTPVVIAEDKFHLELVLDNEASMIQAYVLDGHLEDYVQVPETGFEMTAASAGESKSLEFKRVVDPSTGTVAEKSALFEARGEWLKSTKEFEGNIATITLGGNTFTNVSFPFPMGTKHVH
ncbi:MAG: hypothetical protein K9N62_15115 [Verrucomicrobia bacterium]|jgi:hypothetical protein|nr:hypothetical protein [Verrucomicrobiota bacterium]